MKRLFVMALALFIPFGLVACIEEAGQAVNSRAADKMAKGVMVECARLPSQRAHLVAEINRELEAAGSVARVHAFDCDGDGVPDI